MALAKAPDCRTGLFDPKDIPNPSHENWLKNLQEWETPAKGTKMTSEVNDWK